MLPLQPSPPPPSLSLSLSLFLSPSDVFQVPVLDSSNAAFFLTKHKFPPAKWRLLAIGLKQLDAIQTIGADSADTLSQLVALITHWVANDKEKTWKKLVDAVVMSEESVIAEKLAKDVGVRYPGAASSTKLHVNIKHSALYFFCMLVLQMLMLSEAPGEHTI